MLSSKKGAALMQVLLVAAILAGIATMLLRANLSRVSTAHQTRRLTSSQIEVESCMEEINQMWAAKTPEAFSRDLRECIFYCKAGPNKTNFDEPCYDPAGTGEVTNLENRVTEYICESTGGDGYDPGHVVRAVMSKESGLCQIEYTVQNTQDL